jgi:hypothetical protein
MDLPLLTASSYGYTTTYLFGLVAGDLSLLMIQLWQPITIATT